MVTRLQGEPYLTCDFCFDMLTSVDHNIILLISNTLRRGDSFFIIKFTEFLSQIFYLKTGLSPGKRQAS